MSSAISASVLSSHITATGRRPATACRPACAAARASSEPAELVQHVRVVAVGLAEVEQVVALARDPDRLPQLRHPGSGVPGRRERGAERVAGMALDRPQALRLGELDGLPRCCDGLAVVGGERASAGQAREHPRAACRIAAASLDQREPALERLEALPRTVGMALRSGGRLDDRRGASRVRLGPERGECLLQQRELALGVPDGARRVGGAREHVHPVHAGQRLGIGHAVPQLQRTLQQREHLAVCVHAAGGRRGAHRGGQRRRPVAGVVEVVGRAAAIWASSPARRSRARASVPWSSRRWPGSRSSLTTSRRSA